MKPRPPSRLVAFPIELVLAGFWCVLARARPHQVGEIRLPSDEMPAALSLEPVGAFDAIEYLEALDNLENRSAFGVFGATESPYYRHSAFLTGETKLYLVLTSYGLSLGDAARVLLDGKKMEYAVRRGFLQMRLSAQEYERTRTEMLTAWGVASRKGAILWPLTSQTVSKRVGDGSWSKALAALGLEVAPIGRTRGASTYTDGQFLAALHGFIADCEGQELNPTYLRYIEWAKARRRESEPVPAAATMRQHFGSWANALDYAREHEFEAEQLQADKDKPGE